jgi:predicted P-loop ATPase
VRLTEHDYKLLEDSWILREMALAADITRVDAIEGAELMGLKGVQAATCAGWRIPNRFPGESHVRAYRLRRDHPPIDLRTGKPEGRYLSAPGQRNMIYFPLEDVADLLDIKRPVWIAEGEKKYLALRRAALEGAALLNGASSGKPLALTLAFPGCWGWKGQVGIATDKDGVRVAAKGVIPDLDRIAWKGREEVIILYDSNCQSNEMVRASRKGLARELESRGAIVYWVDLMPEPGINGPDDYLARHGLRSFLDLLGHTVRYDWRHELAMTDKGKVMVCFSNALTALRHAPPWNGVLAYNEFALRAEARAPTPWGGKPGPWSDTGDLLAVEWMERQGVKLHRGQVSDAIQTVAREHCFHPVHDYLDALVWDGTGRLDDWLTLYLGAEQNDYHRAVGARWMISAIARTRKPGCKADCALILESDQGRGKSTAFGILGGEFYSDDIAELGTKDAALGVAGAWIVELAELDAISKAEVSKIKSFLSRCVDRFRPPYGRHIVETPRRCVFCGTVNLPEYLKDATGGRRFWPVQCGEVMRLEDLRKARDQMWAEAVVRYERGEKWWLDNDELIEAAKKQQDRRYQPDAWEELVRPFLASRTEVTTATILIECIHKEPGQWVKTDEMRVGDVLRRMGWEKGERLPESVSPTRQRAYRPKEEKKKAKEATVNGNAKR